MPPIVIPPPVKLRMRINFGRQGLTELYWLNPATAGADIASNAAAALLLCQYRALWFGTDVWMEYASLSDADVQKDGYMVALNGYQRFPGTPTSTAPVRYINDVVDAMEYRFETSSIVNGPASWGTRLFRGIPDYWVVGQEWGATFPVLTRMQPAPVAPISYVTPFVPGAQQLLSPAAQANIVNLQRSFLDLVQLYCGILVKVGGAGGDRANWIVNPYTRSLFRQISSHRTGQPFAQFPARAQKSF